MDVPTLRSAVNLMYQRVLADPDLAPWFAGVDLPRLRAHQLAFLTGALGGPDLFNGRDPATAHAGLEITDAAFDALIGHLASALRDLGSVPMAVDQVVRRLETWRPAVVTSPAEAPTATRPGS
jgi:hemoglobin